MDIGKDAKLGAEKYKCHEDVKPYTCEICCSTFRTSSQLNSHRKTHLEEHKSFECSICGMAFKLKRHVEIHKMTHSGEKASKCQHLGVPIPIPNSGIPVLNSIPNSGIENWEIPVF